MTFNHWGVVFESVESGLYDSRKSLAGEYVGSLLVRLLPKVREDILKRPSLYGLQTTNPRHPILRRIARSMSA
jgi:hypothetical protein